MATGQPESPNNPANPAHPVHPAHPDHPGQTGHPAIRSQMDDEWTQQLLVS